MKRIFFRVDADILLLGVLAPTGGGHVADGPFNDLQQGLLHAFPGNVPRDGNVLGLAADLVDFVHVNNALFRLGYVKIGCLEQAQDDIFHVFTHIAGFRQRGGVHNAERDVQHLRQSLCQQRLAGTGGAGEQDVGLLDFHIVQGLVLQCYGILAQAHVVIVHGYGKHLLGMILADDVLVERGAHFLRGGQGAFIGGRRGACLAQHFRCCGLPGFRLAHGIGGRLHVQDAADETGGKRKAVVLHNHVDANLNAIVADVEIFRDLNELVHLVPRLAAAGTGWNIGVGTGHNLILRE